MVGILVASAAGPLRILEGLALVAGLARDRSMQTDEREPRQVVVECDLLPPVRFVVTGFALGTELAFMGIVLLVAGGAIQRELVTVEIAGVAGVAKNLSVLALEGEFRALSWSNFAGFQACG